MLLLIDGAIVGRSRIPWKNKKGEAVVFHSITVSETETGEMAKLDCTGQVFDKAQGLILKQGAWAVSMSPRDFQGKTALTAIDVVPFKPNKA